MSGYHRRCTNPDDPGRQTPDNMAPVWQAASYHSLDLLFVGRIRTLLLPTYARFPGFSDSRNGERRGRAHALRGDAISPNKTWRQSSRAVLAGARRKWTDSPGRRYVRHGALFLWQWR